MNTSTSIDALRRANPRGNAHFASSVVAAGETVRAQIPESGVPPAAAARPSSRRRLVRLAAVGVPVAAAAAAVALSTGTSPGGEDAIAAVRKAATVTAASAERSGIAVVRITHDGEIWADKTIRWNGADLALSDEDRQGKAGEFLLVDGMMYAIEDGSWVILGSPDSIDPGSGTMPAEYLAAVREDVGGVTLRRISNGVNGLKTARLPDGSTIYRGTVAAESIARKSGFKEGQRIRVLPFGYVAHGEAANPAALLDAAVTVGPDGAVRELSVAWEPAWRYTVTYRNLGATPALEAPADARPLRERLRSGKN